MKNKHAIVILGPEGVGKTQIVNTLLDKPFNPKHVPTIGAEPKTKKASPQSIVFWEVGVDTDQNTIDQCLRIANEVYLVMNLNAQGLDDLQNYLKSIGVAQFAPNVAVTLVITKTDFPIIEENDTLLLAEEYVSGFGGTAHLFSSSNRNEFIITNLIKKTQELMGPSQPIPVTATKASNQSLITELQRIQNGDEGLNLVETVDRFGDETMNDNAAVASIVKVLSAKKEPTTNLKPNSELAEVSRTLFQELPVSASSCSSVSLWWAGIALMLAGLAALIAIALLALQLLGAVTLTSLVSQFAVAVGGLFAMTAPASLGVLSTSCASVGLSTTTAAGLVGASVSLGLMGVGLSMFRCSKQAAAEEEPLTHGNAMPVHSNN